jgi:hypothetical protein
MDHLREFDEFDASEFDDLFALGFEDVWNHCTVEFYIDDLSVYLSTEGNWDFIVKDFFKTEIPDSLLAFIKDLAESKAHTVMGKEQVKTYTNGVRILPESLILSVDIGYAQRDLVGELQKLKPDDRYSGKLGEVSSKVISESKYIEARYLKLGLSALWKRPDNLIQNFGSSYARRDTSDQYVKGAFLTAAKLYGDLSTKIFKKNDVIPKRVTAHFYSQTGKELKKWNSFF